MVHLYQKEEFRKKGGLGAQPTVVEFFSPTCQHCRLLAGVLDDLSQQHPDVLFTTVDITVDDALAAHHDIRSVPTLLFLNKGDIKDRLTGNIHPLVIQEAIRKISE